MKKKSHRRAVASARTSKATSTETEAIDQARKTILNLLAGTVNEITLRYRVGCEVQALKRTYGDGAVGKLARQLGRARSALYEYASVAAAWPDRKEFVKWAKRKQRDGAPLTFSHFVDLARVSDAAARKHLFEVALTDRLSVRQLRKRVRAPGTRPIEQDSFESAVNGLDRLAQRLVDVRERCADLVANAGAEPVTKARSSCEAIKRAAEDLLTLLGQSEKPGLAKVRAAESEERRVTLSGGYA